MKNALHAKLEPVSDEEEAFRVVATWLIETESCTHETLFSDTTPTVKDPYSGDHK